MTEHPEQKLLRLAEAATPGPWLADGRAIEWKKGQGPFDDNGASIEALTDDCPVKTEPNGETWVEHRDEDGPQHFNKEVIVGGAQDEQGGAVGVLRNEDAAFIAALSPATISRLARVVAAVRASHTCGGRVASCGNVEVCNALHALDAEQEGAER